MLDKLIEEAQEVAAAAPQELVTELADLYEVIDAIMTDQSTLQCQNSEGSMKQAPTIQYLPPKAVPRLLEYAPDYVKVIN